MDTLPECTHIICSCMNAIFQDSEEFLDGITDVGTDELTMFMDSFFGLQGESVDQSDDLEAMYEEEEEVTTTYEEYSHPPDMNLEEGNINLVVWKL